MNKLKVLTGILCILSLPLLASQPAKESIKKVEVKKSWVQRHSVLAFLGAAALIASGMIYATQNTSSIQNNGEQIWTKVTLPRAIPSFFVDAPKIDTEFVLPYYDPEAGDKASNFPSIYDDYLI
jgi:hypothetical protein